MTLCRTTITEMGERTQVQTVRHEGEERFRTLVEASKDAIIVIDREGWITNFNPAAEEMFGLPRGRVVGQPVDSLMPGEYRDRHRQAREAYFATGGPGNLIGKTVEICALRGDGEVFPIELSLSAGQLGAERFVLAIIRDVTERKRAEQTLQRAHAELEDRVERRTAELAATNAVLRKQIADCEKAETALKASEMRYRQLLAAVTTYTYSVNVGNGVAVTTGHSTGCLRATGYAPEDYASDPNLWINMVFPDDRETVRKQVDKVLAGEEVPPIEHRILHRNGTIRWVRDTMVSRYDHAGALTRYDGLVEDITERKRAEERFRRLLESAPDAMVIIDQDGKITLVNTQTQRLFGYSREELLGQPVEILIPERFQGRHPERRMSYVANIPARTLGSARELRGLRKDGSEFPAEITLSPLETEEGLLVSSAIRDVTERKRTEQALRENEAQLLAARRIQEHLLPDTPPALPGFDIAGATYPADFAAGDYFDYLTMPDESVGIVIADVSGHGFAPALLAASTHTLLRSLANHHTQVDEILSIANSVLFKETEEDRFVTLLLARIDPRTRSFVYASAGHQTGYLLDHSGELKTCLESTAFPLGVLAGTDFPACEPMILDPGDILVLLTDGVVEAASLDGVPFGVERTLDVLRANRHRAANQIIERLYRGINEFIRPHEVNDDITAVVIRVESNP